MPKYTYLVLTNAQPGRDDEFNDWYSNQHLGDILKLDGFVAAQRFQVVEGASHATEPTHRYMALYEIEADDVSVAEKALAAIREAGTMVVTPAIAAGTDGWYYEPITERVTSSDRLV